MFAALGLAGLLVGETKGAQLWMNDSELRNAFSGHTIAGIYPSGRGFVETYEPDGRVVYRDDRQYVTGRWSISANTFCTIYQADTYGGCYSVRRTSSNCFEFYFLSRTDGVTPRPEEPAWTAQAWLMDQPATCAPGSEI